MRYFNLILLLVSFYSYSVGFSMSPGERDADGIEYYLLKASSGLQEKNIDIALEGSARKAVVRKKYSFTCEWGRVDGVKVSMSSATADGVTAVNNFYFFDENLKSVFAGSYVTINSGLDYTPLSLSRKVCERKENNLQKDIITHKDYIKNQVVLSQGPFRLNLAQDEYVFFTRGDKKTNFINEGRWGDKVIDDYKDINGASSSVDSVFFY